MFSITCLLLVRSQSVAGDLQSAMWSSQTLGVLGPPVMSSVTEHHWNWKDAKCWCQTGNYFILFLFATLMCYEEWSVRMFRNLDASDFSSDQSFFRFVAHWKSLLFLYASFFCQALFEPWAKSWQQDSWTSRVHKIAWDRCRRNQWVNYNSSIMIES